MEIHPPLPLFWKLIWINLIFFDNFVKQIVLFFQFFTSTIWLITKVTAFDPQEFCNCFAAGKYFDLWCVLQVEEEVFVVELHVLLLMHLWVQRVNRKLHLISPFGDLPKQLPTHKYQSAAIHGHVFLEENEISGRIACFVVGYTRVRVWSRVIRVRYHLHPIIKRN